MNRVFGVLGLFVLVFVVGGCKKQAGSDALGSTQGTVAGVQWSVPKKWTPLADRPMRVATYSIPSTERDAEGGECAVSFFGSGQGGNVQANIERWVGQFESAGTPEQSSKTIHGIGVTTVKIAGAYLAPSGPMMMSAGKKEDYMMLGAIVEAPEGMVFFKCTGPSKTMENSRGEFEAMVESMTKK
jgi:hypothetical protein